MKSGLSKLINLKAPLIMGKEEILAPHPLLDFGLILARRPFRAPFKMHLCHPRSACVPVAQQLKGLFYAFHNAQLSLKQGLLVCHGLEEIGCLFSLLRLQVEV